MFEMRELPLYMISNLGIEGEADVTTRAKIKISDDIELREMLDDEYEGSSQVKLCKYALALATHILVTVDYNDINNPVIKTGTPLMRTGER